MMYLTTKSKGPCESTCEFKWHHWQSGTFCQEMELCHAAAMLVRDQRFRTASLALICMGTSSRGKKGSFRSLGTQYDRRHVIKAYSGITRAFKFFLQIILWILETRLILAERKRYLYRNTEGVGCNLFNTEDDLIKHILLLGKHYIYAGKCRNGGLKWSRELNSKLPQEKLSFQNILINEDNL